MYGTLDRALLRVAKSYLIFRRSKEVRPREFIDFDKFTLPGEKGYPLSRIRVVEDTLSRMRVVEDTKTGINEILNWINHFAISISDFQAWSTILTSAEDKDEQFSILVEIITPIAFHTLSFPPAIRGKLAFVCCKLIRDTFNLEKPSGKRWRDHELTESVLSRSFLERPETKGFKKDLTQFIDRLKTIDSETFRSQTLNYRNRANHQITPTLEIG